jgi:hypothetical protein
MHCCGRTTMSMISRHSSLIQTVIVVPKAFPDPRSISSLNVVVNDVQVGTIVRTPGDFNAFSFEESYRATGGVPVLSLSFRAATAAACVKTRSLLPEPCRHSSPIFSRRKNCARRWKSTTPVAFAPGTISTCLLHSVQICQVQSASCRATELWRISTMCTSPKTESPVFACRRADEALGYQEHGKGRRPDIATW